MPADPSHVPLPKNSFSEMLGKGYAQIRLLSLDVVAGAVGGGLLAAGFVHVEMGWPFYIVLGLCVWLVYTLDHLLDARRLGNAASTERHRFHHQHFKTLLWVWGGLALVAGVLAFWKLGTEGIYFGIGMCGLTLLHLLLVKLVGDKTSPFLTKEMGVSLVYAAGIWGLPVIKSGHWDEPMVWLAFGMFFVLATANLLEFSLYEVEIDEQDGHTSFVRALGKKRTQALVFTLLGAVVLTMLVIGVLVLFQENERLGEPAMVQSILSSLPIFGLMTVVLGALLVVPKLFRENERYRIWGDGAFLLPFLCLWLLP